jgi:hypothetical protein
MTNAFTTTYAQIPIRAAEAPTIAKEANLYGFPTVETCASSPLRIGRTLSTRLRTTALQHFENTPRVYTPDGRVDPAVSSILAVGIDAVTPARASTSR